MLGLSHWQDARSILCIGAHVDDIEIGCGGTLLTMLRHWSQGTRRRRIDWFIATSNEQRASEAETSAHRFLSVPNVDFQLHCLPFRDGFLPAESEGLKEAFFELRSSLETSPDLIFTHRLEDRHQDHRTLAELTWNTFRQNTILEYEIPKFEGDLGHPNLYFELDESTAKQKVELLMNCFPSQANKGWFEAETFWALLRLRGLESGSTSPFAEAFTARKLLWK